MRRPQIHFSSPRGWMNDPNGAIQINGVYHLFYQYNPKDILWGNIGWGHATSRDLIHWTNEPIAIEATEDEYVFSGSCFYDKENISGLGNPGEPVLLAFYAGHNPHSGVEDIRIAYSNDLVHFERYTEGPVLVTTGVGKDFRDPKVFLSPKDGYCMIVAAGDHLEFYHSANLLNWVKTSDFDPSEYGFPGICECPDCVAFIDGERVRYCLSMSMIVDDEHVSGDFDLGWKEYRVHHVMQYFIGQFDGERFIDTQVLAEPSVLDYGTDDYAMISFMKDGLPSKSHIMIGWAENWDTVNDRPTISGISKGKMTLPRQASLLRTETGLRLAMKPCLSGEYRLPKRINPNETYAFNPMKPVLVHTELANEGTIRLCNGADEEVLIEVTSDEIVVDCRYASSPQFGLIHDNSARDVHIAKRHLSGNCDLTLIYDEGLLEIYAEEGVTVFTVNVYPNIPYTQLIVLEKLKEDIYID